MTKPPLARIVGTGAYLPEKRLTNADLEKMVDTTDEWIVTRTGIRERRIAGPDEHPSTMGVSAAKQALEQSAMSPSEIDLIIVATTIGDYLFPSTAALIQHQIGASQAAAFDLQATCTGYLYALATAKAFIESGAYKNILLVASEKLSTRVDFTDRRTCILFGDGAAASVVSSKGRGLAIDTVDLGADGEQSNLLCLPGGGCRLAPGDEQTAHEANQGAHFVHMQGREVFKHAVRRMAQSAQRCLEMAAISPDTVQWLVPHQANIRIIDAIARRFCIPMDQVYVTIHKYGNTIASSIPIALHELLQEHEVAPGGTVLLVGFGGGITFGSAILKQLDEEGG